MGDTIKDVLAKHAADDQSIHQPSSLSPTPNPAIKADDQAASSVNLEQTSFNYQVYFTQKDLTFFLVFATFSSTASANDFFCNQTQNTRHAK